MKKNITIYRDKYNYRAFIFTFILLVLFRRIIIAPIVFLIFECINTSYNQNFEIDICNYYLIIIIIWIIIYYVCANKIKIKNNNIKVWYKNSYISLNSVERISVDKNLILHYKSSANTEEKLTIRFYDLTSNKENIVTFLDKALNIINSEDTKVHESAEQIYETIYQNRLSRFRKSGDKPAKIGGTILLWQIQMLFEMLNCLLSSLWIYSEYYNFVPKVLSIDYFFLRKLFVFFLIYAFINIIGLAVSLFRYKTSAKLLIYFHYIKALFLGVFGLWLVLFFRPFFESNFLEAAIFMLYSIAIGMVSAIGAQRYFSRSIRVKNTYIK